MYLDHYTDDYIRVCKDNQIEPKISVSLYIDNRNRDKNGCNYNCPVENKGILRLRLEGKTEEENLTQNSRLLQKKSIFAFESEGEILGLEGNRAYI